MLRKARIKLVYGAISTPQQVLGPAIEEKSVNSGKLFGEVGQ